MDLAIQEQSAPSSVPKPNTSGCVEAAAGAAWRKLEWAPSNLSFDTRVWSGSIHRPAAAEPKVGRRNRNRHTAQAATGDRQTHSALGKRNHAKTMPQSNTREKAMVSLDAS
jgi:hypothetical protein